MKIGIVGNMNNMYSSLTRYLLDKGYDCEQLIFDFEPEHFHPSCDMYESSLSLPCKKLSWGDPAGFLKQDWKKVASDLKKYDVLIGNGTAPAFITRIGRKLDLFIPYGDDIYALPFLRLVHPLRMAAYAVTAWYQRRGIRSTPVILFDKTNAAFEKVFTRLRYKGKRIVSPPPLIYHKEYEEEKILSLLSKHPYHEELETLRAENDLLVLQHVRQLWKPVHDQWNLKGNDRLIRGFASFLKQHPQVKAKLLLFEYGTHVVHSRELISALGIESKVWWFPKMPRKHLMPIIYFSDLIVGELYHSWLSYCVALEAICLGKPLMHKRNDAEFKDDYPLLYPIIYADSTETVLAGLNRFMDNRKEAVQIGIDARKWFLHYCVEKPLDHIVQIIKEKGEMITKKSKAVN